MATATETLNQVLNLSPDEQVMIVDTVLQNASELAEEERGLITETLRQRVDGPFVPYDDEMFDRVKERGRKYLAERNNGSSD